MPIIRRLVQLTVAAPAAVGASWLLYTRKTHFVPFGVPPEYTAGSSASTSPSPKANPEFPASAYALLNPKANPPKLIDHAERRVPLSKLKTTDRAELTREFCRGIWGGLGFEYQRNYLEKKWRPLAGREGMLWSTGDMWKSEYNVGTQIADHFVVVERDEGKVIVRCGDSPLIKEPRGSDGIFSIEVDIDDARQEAIFRLKSIFFNSSPAGVKPGVLPWWLAPAHREYTKLWMEMSVRKLIK